MFRLQSIANVVVSLLNTAIVTAGSFVLTPAILYGLGDGAYGGWLLINSFICYMRLLDLGTSSGTMKFGAGAHERGDKADLRRVLNTSAAIFFVLGITALLATFGLTAVLPHLYPNVATGQEAAILVLGAGIALDLCFRPFAAVLRMRSLFFVHDFIEICTYSVFKLGLILHFAYSRTLSYGVLAVLTLVETIARIVLVVGTALVLFPASRSMNPFRAERAIVRKLARMGAAMTIISIAEIFRFQLDAAVIGYFLPETPLSISIFGVGSRLGSIAFTSIGVIGAVLVPRFSGLSETGDTEGVMKLLRKANLATGLVASLVLVTLAVLGPQFLQLWLKKPWVETSGKILLMMLPAYYIGLLAGPSAGLLIGRGQLRGLTLLTSAEALTNVVLSVVLVRPLGIYGVALGTAIPLAFFHGIVFPMLLAKEIGVTPWQYARTHATAIGIGAVYLVLIGGLTFVPLTSYRRFILLGLGTVFVFGALTLAFVSDARAVLLRLLSRGGTSAGERA